MQFTAEHLALSDTVKRFVENEINPYSDEWEKAGHFPAHEVFKKLGDLGLLGIKYDTAYGGMGLDFSYSMVASEALGVANCGGVPLAIGVQTDMCTPALHRFGSDALKKEFLAPAIGPLVVSCGNQRRQSVVVVAPCGHVGKSQSGLSTCPCGLVVHE
ncbi:acyl-CoA dehydrogenase family protein, partial [Aquabacterium sp.]|uniref:acyl-CoA dehydrogenase family protein n=1 Tax=Aquabacterium sp. TaxID=1872578 RepID=UPI003D0493A0